MRVDKAVDRAEIEITTRNQIKVLIIFMGLKDSHQLKTHGKAQNTRHKVV